MIANIFISVKIIELKDLVILIVIIIVIVKILLDNSYKITFIIIVVNIIVVK